MNSRHLLLGILFTTLSLAGCKSKVEKCMETTDQTYAKQVAACTDDACKKKAEKDKLDWYDACKELK